MIGHVVCAGKDTPRAEVQRERILCAAQKCFIEHGFHAASMASDSAITARLLLLVNCTIRDSRCAAVTGTVPRWP